MKFKNKIIGLVLFTLSAQIASSQHISDRPIYATEIKNATGTPVFNFPTSLPTANRVCTFNSDSEPVGTTYTAMTALLDAFIGDSGSGGTKGLVPAPASGDANKYLKGDGTWATVSGGSGTPGGSDSYIQYNNGGSFGGESTLVYDDASDAVGIQTSAPLAPLHVVGATGATINSVTTGSVTTASESLATSPTGSITLIAEFPAISGSSPSQNTSGPGYTASGQTIDYQIYQLVEANGQYYKSANFESVSFTDPLNDSSSFSVILNFGTLDANATHLLIEKQINGGGFNDSTIIAASSSYEDTNFSGSASTNSWPTQYVLSYTVPTAPSGATGQEINVGFGNLTESGTTYDFEIRSCTNIGGTYYCEQTGTSGNFTDANMGQTFDLQVDYTAGSGDDQVVRISSNGGSTWDYNFTGSGSATSFVWSNQGNNSSAETAWSNDVSSAQIQYAFKAYAKNLNPANNAIVYTPSANTYYATITTPNVYYIFKHDLTGSIPNGAKILADYNSGVTNGQDVSGSPFYDIGYSSWSSGTTLTPTTYAFPNGTTRYFKLVGFSSPIYSGTPFVVNATTSGSGKYFTGSFTYPSGVTTVKILVSTDGVTYTGSKTFNSPTATFTYDSVDNSWGGNTIITPTASVPTSVRIDRQQTSATDVPHLSLIETTGSGTRMSSIGFGAAASSAAAATYQSNIIGYATTGNIGIGAARLRGYTNVNQSTQSWSLGSANELNSQKSSTIHTTIWGGGGSSEPLAYFYSASDSNRGTLYMGNDGLTSSITDAKLVISPEAGGATGMVFNRPSGSSSGSVLRIQNGGSYLGGIAADSSLWINRTGEDTNAWLSFGGSTTKAAIKFGGSLKSSATALGLEGSSDDLYFTLTTGTARKKVALIDPSALTSGRVPFATTNGRLTDDSDFTFATDTLTVTKAKVGSSGNAMDGVFSATATLDFPSIAAQTCDESLTITVTGASTGDVVALGPPSGFENGLSATGFVSASNTVKVRICNVTAGAIDPASATWRALVTSF